MERQGLVERKLGLFKMLAFQEGGGLLSQRLPSLFVEPPEGFIGTSEKAEQRKGEVR